jgi:hypothetical protein
MMMKELRWLVAISVLASCAGTDDAEPGIGGSGGGAAVAGGGGAAGSSGGAGDLFACPPSDEKAPAVLHADALAVLGTGSMGPTTASDGMPVIGSCGFSQCHVSPRGKAALVLTGATSLMPLVGKPSCQAPSIPLIAAGGGDAALANSWLWIKMVAPVDEAGAITAKSAWGAGNVAACEVTPAAPFGVRMPKGSPMSLDARRLAMVQRWICAAAPPP